MTPQNVLDNLTGTGIRIGLENGNLRYHSHKLLDDELINLIRTHKTGLVRLLEAKNALSPHYALADVMLRFRDWWWEAFDCGADSAEFDAGSAEAASELLPVLHGLVAPDFEARIKGSILKLKRVCERHYPQPRKEPHDEGHD